MDFLKKLSCLFGKQYLFLETKEGIYYNRWISARQTKEEAENWLLKMLERNDDF